MLVKELKRVICTKMENEIFLKHRHLLLQIIEMTIATIPKKYQHLDKCLCYHTRKYVRGILRHKKELWPLLDNSFWSLAYTPYFLIDAFCLLVTYLRVSHFRNCEYKVYCVSLKMIIMMTNNTLHFENVRSICIGLMRTFKTGISMVKYHP